MSSRNRSDDQMKCVYMGPPMRRNLLDSLKERLAGNKPKKSYPGSFADDRDPDEPELEEVYMGPPLTEEPEPGPEPGTLPEPAPETKEPFNPRAMEGVYAGPDMQNVPPMAPVYAGPEMMNDPQWDPRVRIPDGPRMEALYAAPRRPQPSEMMMVYAGPDYFTNKKNSQAPMMMVYAGPPNMPTMAEQMEAARKQAENRTEAPDFRNEEQDPEDLGKPTVCPGCGASVPQSRFCSECGAMLPGTLMVKCSCCGSIVRKGKFCIECGALFPQEESSPEA